MKASQVLRPKSPRLFKGTLLASVAMLVSFAIASGLRPWSPKRGLGLAFGMLAAALFVFEMLYPARRPRAVLLGSARSWLQAHVYAGMLGLVAALVHSGLAWPSGRLGFWLLLLALWTSFSGLLGVWLQKWIPASLAEGLRVEALYERIPELVQGLRDEADTLIEGSSDVLDRFYKSEVRASLGALQPSWTFLMDVRGGRERALEPFRRVAQFVEENEKEKVDDLISLYTEKLELDAHYSLQGLLRRWLVLHVPAAGALMGLLAVHVFGWVFY
jgi:hypothetical protein